MRNRTRSTLWALIPLGGIIAGASVFGHRWPWLAAICVTAGVVVAALTIARARREARP